MTTMRFALLTGLLVAGGAAYGMLQVPRLQDPPKAKVDALVAKAKSLGFATDQLIWVKQTP